MKAALMVEAGKPLVVQDVPKPEIGSHEVLVKVAACGVCHTDLHYIDHGTPTFKKPPIILGHEISGTVAACGSSVSKFQEGDPVLLPAVLTCGSCEFCRRGRENICSNMIMFGNHINGGFAEYVATPAKDILPLPKEMPLADASIIADAVSTPYHAVANRGQVRPGDSVAVFGCGGVGINVVQMSALFGADVIRWFNGGLFDTGDVIPLTGTEITTLLEVSKLNWALIEPAIFGTLFERGLDPDQRAQLGAHYTDRDAIWGLVEPVILRPLRREYVEMQTQVTKLLMSGRKVTKSTPRATPDWIALNATAPGSDSGAPAITSTRSLSPQT